MRRLTELWRQFRWLRRRNELERELRDEFRFHLDQQTDRNLRAGMTPDEASRRAYLSFGGTENFREQCRDEQRLPIVESAWQDMRYASRALRRTPAFTLAVLLTLSLGIGASTAIFSVVNAVLLQPPPYPESNRILVLGFADGGSQDGQTFHYIRERTRSFESIAAHGSSSGWNLVVNEHAEYVAGLPVSADFFDVLGVAPLLGRVFEDDEDQANGPRAVVLTEGLWRRLFGGQTDAVGAVVLLGGVPHTLVGVMPSDFRSVPAADVWTPLRLSSTDYTRNYTVFGRLRGDKTPAQASSELSSLRPDMSRDLRGISEARSQAQQWISYQHWLGLADRSVLMFLLGAVLFLLVIACVNVASLQLVRAIARRREMATRSALGGGNAQLARLVLTESVLLSMAGAGAGILVANVGIRSLLTLIPTGMLDGRSVVLDWRVLAVTLLVALGAGVFFGLTPVLAAMRIDIRAALWESSHNSTSRPTMWLRRLFAVVEVSLAVLLLVCAGLLVRTFVNLQTVEIGFNRTNIVIGKMSLQGSARRADEQYGQFLERTLARLQAVPGVIAVAVGNNVPIEQGLNLSIQPPAGALVDEMRSVDWRYVTPGYFDVFGVPLRNGRGFDERDQSGSPPVAMVNEAFARAYFGNSQVLGRALQITTSTDAPREIVGVIADVKGRSGSGWTRGMSALGSPVAPAVYVPAAQVPEEMLLLVHRFFPISWVIRTSRGVNPVPAVQQVLKSAEPHLPFIGFETMDQVIAHDLEMQRFLVALVSVFASLALALATVGIYGLVAYSASQRTHEVGIRIALGATRLRILRTFLSEGMVLTTIGIALGLSSAMVASRLLTSIVFGIKPLDPLTFAAVGALLMVVTGVATLMPALRASRTDPTRALRFE